MKRWHLYVQCACIQFNQDDDGIITNNTGMFFVDFNCTGCNPYRPYSIKTRNHSASVTNLNAKWNHFAMVFFFVQQHFFSLYFHYGVKISILMKCLERIGFFENIHTNSWNAFYETDICTKWIIHIYWLFRLHWSCSITLYKVSYTQYCCT